MCDLSVTMYVYVCGCVMCVVLSVCDMSVCMCDVCV